MDYAKQLINEIEYLENKLDDTIKYYHERINSKKLQLKEIKEIKECNFEINKNKYKVL